MIVSPLFTCLQIRYLLLVLRERKGIPELECGPLWQLDLVVFLDSLHDIFVLGNRVP